MRHQENMGSKQRQLVTFTDICDISENKHALSGYMEKGLRWSNNALSHLKTVCLFVTETNYYYNNAIKGHFFEALQYSYTAFKKPFIFACVTTKH